MTLPDFRYLSLFRRNRNNSSAPIAAARIRALLKQERREQDILPEFKNEIIQLLQKYFSIQHECLDTLKIKKNLSDKGIPYLQISIELQTAKEKIITFSRFIPFFKRNNSSDIAKKRIIFLLEQERREQSITFLEFKDKLIQLLQKYFSIQTECLDSLNIRKDLSDKGIPYLEMFTDLSKEEVDESQNTKN